MYQMYLPPDNGYPPAWAPIRKLAWHWEAEDYRASPDSGYPNAMPGTSEGDGYTHPCEFPTWMSVFTNVP
jgi:hypothetical protein